jgi:hypothetical protein
MSDALPFALLALVVALLAAMPWQRFHPNHQFMLKLLSSHLCDEPTGRHPAAETIRIHTTRSLPTPVNQIWDDLMSETGSSFHADQHPKTLLALHTNRCGVASGAMRNRRMTLSTNDQRRVLLIDRDPRRQHLRAVALRCAFSKASIRYEKIWLF